MLDFFALKEKADIRKSKALDKIAQNGANEMYGYLSGNRPDSTYTAQNIKYIMTMHGKIDWSKVDDITNSLFSIGYSDQGNIIGILTNTNSILQDMLCYCDLEEAKEALSTALSIGVADRKVRSKRYAVNGQSPLTFGLPVITRSNYRTMAVVVNEIHAKIFTNILETLDINALNELDMFLIAKDFEFISRTQELAIDVAKDKAIEIVDTSKWLMPGVKDRNFWLSKSRQTDDWLAEDNLQEMLNSKKDKKSVPEFKVTKKVPVSIQSKIHYEVTTSATLASEAILRAGEDYFNSEFKELLLYTKETELSEKARMFGCKYPNLSRSIESVLKTYRSYMIDNIPNITSDTDTNTAIYLRKESKRLTTEFAKLCRNTIYRLGNVLNLNMYTIAMITYGVDLANVSKGEGKYFRVIMPEEFKKLYANGQELTSMEKLFFVDEDIKDRIEDGEIIEVDFVNGKAYDENSNLIAKTSYKYNATKAVITCQEDTGRWFAKTNHVIEVSKVGADVIIPIEDIETETAEYINNTGINLTYYPSIKDASNILCEEFGDDIIEYAKVGNRGHLSIYHRLMLIKNRKLNEGLKANGSKWAESFLQSPEAVENNALMVKIKLNQVLQTNKHNDIYKKDYAVVSL